MKRVFYNLDWIMLFAALTLVLLGLAAMRSFAPGVGAEDQYFFNRQIIWLLLGLAAFFAAVFIDWSFLKTNSIILIIIYAVGFLALLVLVLGGHAINGAASWYRIYSLQIEPVEIMKIIIVLILAKYFSKRHVEIAKITHLFISGLYVLLPALLVLLQPDFGSALILAGIWLGAALLSGIKLRHIFFLLLVGAIIFLILWQFILLPYQKTRILSFLNPAVDTRGAGYHSLQAMIAVGSGEILGKGIGYGTQSRLLFLPEKETDFIFAAFAEEWGFFGVLILFIIFGILLWRILRCAIYEESNFEKLYAGGLAIFIFFQASIHIGMNIGLLPITGLGMPFLSYGGSSLISLFLAIGILESFALRKSGIFLGSEERFKEGILGA